jgi:uncharacterized repeat protein (TIGR01451 family)
MAIPLPLCVLGAVNFIGLLHGREAPPQGPDLAVTVLRYENDARPIVVAGGTVTLSIAVNNRRGDAEAHSTTLTVTLPSGMKLEQATPPPIKSESANVARLIWNLGTMPRQSFPRLFQLVITANPNVAPDTLLPISVTVATTDKDVNPENNNTGFLFQVVPAVADIAVESDLGGTPLTIGSPVEFTVSAQNWGSVTARSTLMTLVVPPKILIQSADPAPSTTESEKMSWRLGDIEPTGKVTVRLKVTVDPSLIRTMDDPTSSLNFKLDASTTTPDRNPVNNHLEINKRVETPGFDLQVWLSVQGSDTPRELPIGKDVTYTVTYGNFGNQIAPKSTVSLSLPDGLSLLSAEPAPARSTKTDRYPGGVASWDSGDLRVGESKLIQCKVHVASVPEEGSVVMAKVSADGVDIDTRNNVAYSWRRAPRGMATRVGTGMAANLPGSSQHSYRWIWVVILFAIAVASWFVIRLRRNTPTQ